MQPTSDIKIVSINGNNFVSGLVWEALVQRSYMREAREIGKREKMDIVAIRLGFMAQAGFVKKGNGVTKGMYSLAAALAGQIPHKSWIGAFALPDEQFALVAVYDGMIVSGCDLIADKETVLDRLREMDSQRSVMEFSKVFHPADVEYRGDPLDIEEVLVAKAMRKDYALKQLTFGLTKRELVQLGAGVTALLCLGLGYQQWDAYKTREAFKEAQRQEAARQKALAELNARAGAEQTVKALQHPWATQPGMVDFLNACQGAVNSLPLAMGGWTFESAKCTEASLETVYQRSGKTPFNSFVQAAQGRFAAPPALLEGGDKAMLGDQVSIGAGGDDELLPFEQLQADFTSYLQVLDLKATMVPVPVAIPPQPPLPGGAEAPPPLKPDWQQFSFTLTSPYAPLYLFAGLHLKGVRLTEISVVRTGPALSWSAKGDIYAH
jgi:hypothetical protein